MRSVLDLNKVEISSYPTSLAELERAGSVQGVRRNMDVENGDSILTGRANTLVEMNENSRKAFLYSNTAVTFDAFNVMAIERGALFLVNPRGRFEIIRRGIARILANSTLYVEVTSDGGLLVYVFEGLVSVTTSLGGVELAGLQAGRVTGQGAVERTNLSASEQSRISAEAQGAESVMSSGGGIPGAAVAAIVAGAGVGGYLVLKQTGVIDGETADLAVEARVRGATTQIVRDRPMTLVEYTVAVVNLGPATATGVVLTSEIGANQTFQGTVSQSSELSCTTGRVVSCRASQLGPDQSLQLVYVTISEDTKGPWQSRVEARANETDPDPTNNTATPRFVGAAAPPVAATVELTTALTAGDDGRVIAQIEHNGEALPGVNVRFPSRLRLETSSDANVIVAYLTSPLPEGSVWTFDFSATSRFAESSFQVAQGQVLTRSPRAIAFRMTGTRGERIEFRYRLTR